MNFKEQPIHENQKFIEFKTEAEELRGLIVRMSGVNELVNNPRAIAGRTRAETAATLLKELPEELDDNMLEFRKKVLNECEQGMIAFKPNNEADQELKEEAMEIIEELETF